MLEEELFEPVKELFLNLGYRVNAEVAHCDVTARREDELVVVELKRNLSVTLLTQGVNRQKIGANVYVAVPKPKSYRFKEWKDTLYLLKKLELGLIFVTLKESLSFAQIIIDPEPFNGTKTFKARKNAILSEIESRRMNINKGGSVRKKIATAYTEKAIHIACLLEKYGQMSTKQLRGLGTDEKKTTSILYKNHFGWFEGVSKGIYKLSEAWYLKTDDYMELIEYYQKLVNEE